MSLDWSACPLRSRPSTKSVVRRFGHQITFADPNRIGEETLQEMVTLASGIFVKLCYSGLFLTVLW